MKKQSNPDPNKIPLYDASGKKVETLELEKEIFTGKPNEPLLYQAIRMYRANQRMGTVSTKTRGDVSGGGKKPWRQKGTGRARVGSIRNPLWRHGGIAFGPHPRDFSYDLPKKIKKNAFISSINAKLKSGQLIALDDIKLEKPKTKDMALLMKKLKLEKRVLLLAGKVDKNLALACRNLKNMSLKSLNDANAYDILTNDHVVITRMAADLLNEKVKQ